MKGRYFFVENGKDIEIQEFDFDYVLNSLLKEYDRREKRKYCYTVIVKRTYDTLGNPIFDVRTLDLEDIHYNSRRLNMMELMKGEINFKNPRIRDLPMPALQREYMDWKEGKIKPNKAMATIDVPAPIVLERKEILPTDPRLDGVALLFEDKPEPMHDALKVLDWVDNLPVCSHEVSLKIQKVSDRQLDLDAVLHQHSDYIRTLLNNLTTVLETVFPLKPTFTQKLFGSKPSIKISAEDLPKVMRQLKQAVQYDMTKFSGLEPLIKEIRDDVLAIKEEIDYGKTGCEYAIATIEEPFEYELTQERLMKMGISNTMTETSLVAVSKNYQVDVNRVLDIQTVTIPLIIQRLRNQVGQAIDESTADIIRGLAYGKDK